MLTFLKQLASAVAARSGQDVGPVHACLLQELCVLLWQRKQRAERTRRNAG